MEAGAHVMKLPYTPIQFAVRHGEEEGELRPTLDGMPVVGCSLHSQVAPVALRCGLAGRLRSAPWGCLTGRAVRTVRSLRAQGLVDVAIGAGACFEATWTP